jgi:hypothetical protein
MLELNGQFFSEKTFYTGGNMSRKRRKTDAAPRKRTPQSSDGIPVPTDAPESIVAASCTSNMR